MLIYPQTVVTLSGKEVPANSKLVQEGLRNVFSAGFPVAVFPAAPPEDGKLRDTAVKRVMLMRTQALHSDGDFSRNIRQQFQAIFPKDVADQLLNPALSADDAQAALNAHLE
ncbi:MAG: hypothetical protein K2Q01_04950, partial [Rickettsiales bacterium]|nr:hypothetical protein [Rickettsiales bacterium]